MSTKAKTSVKTKKQTKTEHPLLVATSTYNILSTVFFIPAFLCLRIMDTRDSLPFCNNDILIDNSTNEVRWGAIIWITYIISVLIALIINILSIRYLAKHSDVTKMKKIYITSLVIYFLPTIEIIILVLLPQETRESLFRLENACIPRTITN